MAIYCDNKLTYSFDSYFSLYITGTLGSNSSTAQFNPFQSSSYSANGYSTAVVKTSDISFDSSTGKVTFKSTGSYLVAYGACLFGVSADDDHVTGSLYKNGARTFTTDGVFLDTSIDPRHLIVNTVLDFVPGDTLEARLEDSNNKGIIATSGSYLTLLRSKGDYGTVKYVAKSNETESTAWVLYDTANEGGGIESKLGGLSFGADGKYTIGKTRKYIVMSSFVTNPVGSGNKNHTATQTFSVGGSAKQAMKFGVRDSAAVTDVPTEASLALAYGLAGGDVAHIEINTTVMAGFDGDEACSGSSFTIFDVTSDGKDPNAYISFSVTGDSNALDPILPFDSDSYGTFATSSYLAESGITFAAASGQFTIANAGKYLFLWNQGMVGNAATYHFQILKGSDIVYQSTLDSKNTNDPRMTTACIILDVSADDVFTFKMPNLGTGDAKSAEGSSITIIKLDDTREVNAYYGHEAVGDLIDNNFTFNTYSSNPYERYDTRQIPFVKAIPGPLSLRGRCWGDGSIPPNVSMGNKKN
jgi:hypothetical protein